MRQVLLASLAAMVLVACSVQVIHHDEDRAAADASEVLKSLYFDENYEDAYEKLAPEFQKYATVEKLKEIAEALKSRFGRLEELKLDSFLPVPGQRAITLFYDVVNEKGLSYHRVLLAGDAKGYKVVGLLFANGPYPEHKLRQKFAKASVIRRE